MELFIGTLQSFQDTNGIIYGRFSNVYLLETAHNALATGKVAIVFIIRSGANKADVALFQVRFQHIGSVKRTVADTSSTDEIMNLVDIDNGVAFFLQAVHDLFDAFLKITTVLRTSQHGSHVHLIHFTSLQARRHLIVNDSLDQSIDQGCLSHTWLSHMQRIVFILPAKHLDGTFQFHLAPNERMMAVNKVIQTSNQIAPRLLGRV